MAPSASFPPVFIHSLPLALFLTLIFLVYPLFLEIPNVLGFVHLGHGYPVNTPVPEQLLGLLWLINQRPLMQISILHSFVEYVRKY